MATLSFKGKTFVQNHHLTVKYHQLVPQKDKSLTDLDNLPDPDVLVEDIIENLESSLESLREISNNLNKEQ